jgi:thiol-disulfide isomerase/thioredoxin
VVAAVLAGLGAAALALVLVGPGGGEADGRTDATATVPVSGPPVRLEGSDAVTGEPVGLDELLDRPVVVTVWASWCAACRGQAEPLRELLAKRPNTALLAVDTQEAADAARAFLADHGLSIPTIADTDGRLAAKLGVRELPTTLFLTSDHRVAGMWEGVAPFARLRAGLASTQRG